MGKAARAWVGLGGNSDDSASLLHSALLQLDALPRLELLRRSELYRSPPWGFADQPDFVNAVAEFETTLAPLELLDRLRAMEARLGRKPQTRRWGPRCIDLDLLTYEGVMLDSKRLVLPHPRMHLRAFVLVPLLRLEPDFVIPGIGPAKACLQSIDAREIAAVEAFDSSGWEDP